MVNVITSVAIYILIFTSSSFAQSYDIKDLEQLADSKNYEEFLAHARDIRPSKRDKYWKDLVQSMAIGQVDFLIDKKIYNKSQFELIEKISLWPTLNSDSFFQVKRNNYAQKYLKSCFEKAAKYCKSQLFSFWHSSNQRPELAMSLVEYLKLYTDHKDFWGFYEKVTRSDLQEYYCSKPHLKKAVFSHLKNNLMEIEDKKVINRFIKANIGATCWFSIVDDLKGLLFTNAPIMREFAYKILDTQDALSQVERDSFHTFYLLDNPVNGDLFNRAWATVETLGQNYGRRMNVYKYLLTLDPLPGNIFAHRVGLKREAVAGLFHSNFPEYIDHYARTCVNFYKGIGNYPTGIPTLHCNDLFKITKDRPWVNQTLKIQFSSIKK
ncbi:hypothetical protein [Halobacteriovorax sp. HLS]|uniref:hypothetical protein n=1 Tax=Halobacteriovorax sp. HLS TaxID=2234000 RepID=UPI000FD98B5E|nr:hypothetical protein [Halobacteriovorax sp. HLS]